MDLLATTEENIRKLRIGPERLLIGVSGGVDSMVLLDVLAALASRHGWRLGVAHFNHQLRSIESEGDEAFVRSAADKRGLPFFAGREDVATFAGEKGWSIEMAARKLRHSFLAETAATFGSSRIALAQHADDQIETFWLRLLRGDVGAGLCGMQWERESEENRTIRLIRPFLNVRKAEIHEYAKSHSLEYREDSSNSDPRFQRNRLRREVIPALEGYQPRLAPVTLRAVEVLLAEKEFITEAARRWLAGTDMTFEMAHLAVQREALRLQLLELGATPSFGLIEDLRLHPDKKVTVAPKLVIMRSEAGRLVRTVGEAAGVPPENERHARISLGEPGELHFEARRIGWQFVTKRGSAEDFTEYFDADAVGQSAVVRFWRFGDKFRPIGNAAPSKVQDLFTNLKVPAAERRTRLVAESEAGEIFWVEGLRIGHEHQVQAATRRVLKWTWQPA